jgi:endogenous inhibitor of DNA gyrase (YacG/DUF329 family)
MMKELLKIKCDICGNRFIKYHSGMRYCSPQCRVIAKNQMRRDAYVGKRSGGSCPYNVGLVCDDPKCSTCGWNPDVKAKRMQQIGV